MKNILIILLILLLIIAIVLLVIFCLLPCCKVSPEIKSGSGTVSDADGYFTIGTGNIGYSVAGAATGTGYIYSELNTDPALYFADWMTPSFCGVPSEKYGYKGISDICQFISAADHSFNNVPDSVKIGDKNSNCYQGILLFRQNSLYGALEFVDIDNSGVLHYNYWYDESGGSDFSSLCE